MMHKENKFFDEIGMGNFWKHIVMSTAYQIFRLARSYDSDEYFWILLLINTNLHRSRDFDVTLIIFSMRFLSCLCMFLEDSYAGEVLI